jgi:hypothetical protein
MHKAIMHNLTYLHFNRTTSKLCICLKGPVLVATCSFWNGPMHACDWNVVEGKGHDVCAFIMPICLLVTLVMATTIQVLVSYSSYVCIPADRGT